MNRHGALLALLCCGILVRTAAQDAQTTQFYATPTVLSPAFAGTAAQTRIGLAYRDQWPAFPGAFVTANLALDHYLSEVNSGLGLLVQHDKAGSGALRYTTAAFQYAYEIELKRRVFLRPALQFGWVHHAVDYSRLVFGDQLARGGGPGIHDNLDGRSISYADMGTGLLFFTPKLWLGAALHHLNRPNQSLLANESVVPRRLGVHGGYRMGLRTPVVREHPQSMVFAFNYRAQEKYDQLDIGGFFEREPVFAGLWYRGLPLLKSYAPGFGNSDALAVLAGVMVHDLRVGYSYDITISQLAGRTAGAHELTLGYELAKAHKKKPLSKRRVVPCAKF